MSPNVSFLERKSDIYQIIALLRWVFLSLACGSEVTGVEEIDAAMRRFESELTGLGPLA